MPSKSAARPPCSLYLITPPLSGAEGSRFEDSFAEVIAAASFASVLVRFAAPAQNAAKAIAAPLLALAAAANCALLIEDDPRLAARIGADGVHVSGAGDALKEAVKSLKPERIVGAGALPTRDDAMTAGERGADYVMFGEPRADSPPMAFDRLLDRVDWWSEIFETPCVAYAQSLEAAAALAGAGADFVAFDRLVWEAGSPADAARRISAAIAQAQAEAS
jgi:thiamine-phosphate pyrophosphorylase